MEEVLYDMEAFVLRRGLARATEVRHRNAATAAAPQLGDMEEVAPAGPAAAAVEEVAEPAVRSGARLAVGARPVFVFSEGFVRRGF